MDVGTTYRRSVEFWVTTVSRATGDWSQPTPCPAWNVRQLVKHVVGEAGSSFTARAARSRIDRSRPRVETRSPTC